MGVGAGLYMYDVS